MEQVNAVSTLSNLYFLGAFALAAGLVIDAFKHFIEWLLTCTRWKRLVWGELKKEELKAIEKNLCPTTVNHVLQRYSLLYHTYEFFSNLTVAMIIAAAWWLLFWGEHYRPFFFSYGTVKGAGILAVIGIVSGGLGFLYKSKANELIGRFNRGR